MKKASGPQVVTPAKASKNRYHRQFRDAQRAVPRGTGCSACLGPYRSITALILAIVALIHAQADSDPGVGQALRLP
jgi:hypothetical protein